MAGLLTLLSLSVVMAVASFLAGILPLSLTLSQSQLRLISTIGMGVLVGTSLIVIIPEGVETLYSTTSASHSHKRDLHKHSAMDVRWLPESGPHSTVQMYARHPADHAPAEAFDLPGPVIPNGAAFEPPKTPTEPGLVGALSEPPKGKKETEDEDHEDSSPHAWVGIALISGFLLMYLIDKVPQYTKPSSTKPQTHHIALNNLGRRFNLTTSLDRDEAAESFLDSSSSEAAATQRRGFATTIGLVIHAAADGIALGASSTTAHRDLSLIIFFAIMLHKAPAAFGLTSILLKQGLSKRSARGHLVLFSLAAPAGALVTYILANILGGLRGGSVEGTTFWTGMLLLFSGGTFLYVAMHAMQETSRGHQEGAHAHAGANGYVDGGGRDAQQQAEEKPSLRDLGAAVFGMVLPLFLQIGHAH
jgi:solute carrier family 39 (zinc transporter), member 9